MIKKTLLLFFVLSTSYAIFSLAVWHLTEGFSLKNIASDFPNSNKWEVATPPKEEIENYASQNFYYLGRGSQMYVFESEDKQVVLKLFRLSRYRVPKITHYFTFPNFLAAIQKQKKIAKNEKLDVLFQSCKLGFEELREETGLLYLHLNKTTGLNQRITLYDKLKRPYHINIDNYPFIIQKRGQQCFSYLSGLLKKDRKIEAKEALASLAMLLSSRIKKGIADHDAVICKNSGFCGNKALFLDVGEFAKQNSSRPEEEELWKITFELRQWLKEQDPQMAIYFDRLIKSYTAKTSIGLVLEESMPPQTSS